MYEEMNGEFSVISYKCKQNLHCKSPAMIFSSNCLRLLNNTKGTEKVKRDICKHIPSILKFHLKLKLRRKKKQQQKN